MSEVSAGEGGRRRARGSSRRGRGGGGGEGGGAHASPQLRDGPSPPDKRAYEEKIKQLTECIEEKEKQIRHTPIDNTDLSAQMRARGEDLEQAEAERTRVNQEVKKVEQNLKHLGDEVAKQKDIANRQAVELRYRSESSYDQHIAKLQHQLDAGDFRPDDKVKVKLEAEIIKLQTCKVQLREYLAVKAKIDSKVDEQDRLRKLRDSLYREVKKLKEKVVDLRDAQEDLRQQMDSRKGKQRELKSQQDELKREIDDLYKQRKELRESFMQEQALYSEAVRKARQTQYEQQQEAAKQKEHERKIAREVRKKQKEAEKEMKREQEYDAERSTCRALINFLETITPTPDGAPSESSAEGGTQASPPTKKAEEEWVPAGGRRKSRKEKKKSSAKVQHKILQFNPTTLYQFSQMRMTPPFSVSQIPQVLEELKDRLRTFEGMARAQSEAGDSGIGMCDANNGLNSGEQTPTSTANEKSGSPISTSSCSSPVLNKLSSDNALPTTQVEQGGTDNMEACESDTSSTTAQEVSSVDSSPVVI